MPSKKNYLQQFGIIHLPNPDLTYIRNPERETKLYLWHSTSWKLKSGTLLCYLFFFSPSHLTRNHDANRARIFTRWRLVFPSCQKLPSLLPNCWRSIFNVFAKNQKWQLDLPNCWRCSYFTAKKRSITKSPSKLIMTNLIHSPYSLSWVLQISGSVYLRWKMAQTLVKQEGLVWMDT